MFILKNIFKFKIKNKKMGCKESKEISLPKLLCFFETGNLAQSAYCLKVRDSFKHEKSINYQIKSEKGMKFSIQFKIKDKTYDIQTEFNDNDESLNIALNKMYKLLD